VGITKEQTKLFAVTDRTWMGDRSLPDMVEDAIKGGATMIQLREKDRSVPGILEDAEAIQKVCRAYHVPFIINDDIALAYKMGADGVHLGQDDMSPKHARSTLGPDKYVGVIVHDEIEARLAVSGGANYLSVGCMYASPTRKDRASMTPEELKRIVDTVPVPVIAFGGLTMENVSILEGCGVSGIESCSGIFNSDNVLEHTKAFRKIADELIG
jgi:thiamine-phosphate pyrophosphorylase